MDLKYALKTDSYSWYNTLTWGVCAEHFKKAKKGTWGDKIIHLLIGLIDILPPAAVLEKLIVSQIGTPRSETAILTKKFTKDSDSITIQKTKKHQSVNFKPESEEQELRLAKQRVQSALDQGKVLLRNLEPQIQKLEKNCSSFDDQHHIKLTISEFKTKIASLKLTLDTYGSYYQFRSKDILNNNAQNILKKIESLQDLESSLASIELQLNRIERQKSDNQDIKAAISASLSILNLIENKLKTLEKTRYDLSHKETDPEILTLLNQCAHEINKVRSQTDSLQLVLKGAQSDRLNVAEMKQYIQDLETKSKLLSYKMLTPIENQLNQIEQIQRRNRAALKKLNVAQKNLQELIHLGSHLLNSQRIKIAQLEVAHLKLLFGEQNREIVNQLTQIKDSIDLVNIQMDTLEHSLRTAQSNQNDLNQIDQAFQDLSGKTKVLKDSLIPIEQKLKQVEETQEKNKMDAHHLQDAIKESKAILNLMEHQLKQLETTYNSLVKGGHAMLLALNPIRNSIDKTQHQVDALKQSLQAAQKDQGSLKSIQQWVQDLKDQSSLLDMKALTSLEDQMRRIESQAQANKEAAALQTAKQNLRDVINASKVILNPIETKFQELETTRKTLLRGEHDQHLILELNQCKPALDAVQVKIDALKQSLQKAQNQQVDLNKIAQAARDLEQKSRAMSHAELLPVQNELVRIEQVQRRHRAEIERQAQVKESAKQLLLNSINEGTTLATRLKNRIDGLRSTYNQLYTKQEAQNGGLRHLLKTCSNEIADAQRNLDTLNDVLQESARASRNAAATVQIFNDLDGRIGTSIHACSSAERQLPETQIRLNQIQQRITQIQQLELQKQAELRRELEEAKRQEEQRQAEAQRRQAQAIQPQEAVEPPTDVWDGDEDTDLTLTSLGAGEFTAFASLSNLLGIINPALKLKNGATEKDKLVPILKTIGLETVGLCKQKGIWNMKALVNYCKNNPELTNELLAKHADFLTV